MPPLQLADLPEAIPIPYRSAEAPDGLDLYGLLRGPLPIENSFRRLALRATVERLLYLLDSSLRGARERERKPFIRSEGRPNPRAGAVH